MSSNGKLKEDGEIHEPDCCANGQRAEVGARIPACLYSPDVESGGVIALWLSFHIPSFHSLPLLSSLLRIQICLFVLHNIFNFKSLNLLGEIIVSITARVNYLL